MISSVIHEALLAGSALGLAAGGCSYAALWPESQIYGRTLVAPANPDELALTFDDGPNPEWTPRLLDILAKYNVRATFFVVGRYAARQRILILRIAGAGHAIGNHSWSHPNLALCSYRRIREELTRTQAELEQTLGTAVRLFRPPFGARRPGTLQIAREEGLAPVLWNAVTSDWSARSAEWIVHRLAARIERNRSRGCASNIVLHDGGHLEPEADRSASVGAAEAILRHFAGLRRFVVVGDWL